MADNTDPSKMTDDELNNAINPPEPSKPPNEPPEPSTPPEPSKPAPSEPPAPPENEEEEEVKPPSRRESLRISQLVEKLKARDNPPTPAPAASGGIDYKKDLEADPELVERLEADRKATNDSSYNQGLEQVKSMRFHTRLEIDAPKIEAKYPIFDKDSEKFNPVVANSINQWYLASTGFDAATDTVKNSEIRYSDFVESLMELADEMAVEQSSATRENITKQAANTGLRPDGSASKRLNLNKPPEKMTDEELKAVIAQAGM